MSKLNTTDRANVLSTYLKSIIPHIADTKGDGKSIMAKTAPIVLTLKQSPENLTRTAKVFNQLRLQTWDMPAFSAVDLPG